MLRWRYVTLASAVATLSIAVGLVQGGIVPFVPVPKMDSETLVGSPRNVDRHSCGVDQEPP